MTIEYWLAAVTCMGLVPLVLGIQASVRRSRDRKCREQLRRLELVLLPKETVRAVCPQKGGRWVLTSRRLLMETGQGFTAIPIKSIQRVQGLNEKGNRTTSIPKMARLRVKAEQEYVLDNSCGEFEAFAKLLLKRTQKKKKKAASSQ